MEKTDGALMNRMRKSNFELLRIISMYCIILYHLIYFFIEPLRSEVLYWKACQIPLHIGVLLFVMISGYFQIKTSLKGVVHILIITFVYYVPVEIIIDILNGNYDTILKHLMFLSNGPYWFISTYLMLYLLAPVINLYISISSQKRYYLTVVTGIFAVYFGSFSHDLSLLGGKNIINFIFLYLLGYNIKVNKCQFEQIKIRYPVIVFCLLNTLSIITYINQMSIRGGNYDCI